MKLHKEETRRFTPDSANAHIFGLPEEKFGVTGSKFNIGCVAIQRNTSRLVSMSTDRYEYRHI